MKLKIILYMTCLLAVAGMQAAERVQIANPEQQVLQKFAHDREILHQMSDVAQAGLVRRAGSALRAGADYLWHFGKYPVMATGMTFPLVWAWKDDFLHRDYLAWIVGAAAVTGTGFGLYAGPVDAARARFERDTKSREADRLDQEYITEQCAWQLVAAKRKLADFERIHGTLDALVRAVQASQGRLEELTAAAAQVQVQLGDVLQQNELAKIGRMEARGSRLESLLRTVSVLKDSQKSPVEKLLDVQSFQRELQQMVAAAQAEELLSPRVELQVEHLTPAQLSQLQDAYRAASNIQQQQSGYSQQLTTCLGELAAAYTRQLEQDAAAGATVRFLSLPATQRSGAFPIQPPTATSLTLQNDFGPQEGATGADDID